MAKRFIIILLSVWLTLLALTAAAVFVLDPLYRYHLPWFGSGMPLFSERYQNAGLIRHCDYNAVILGSSMVESFRASWYDAAFGCRALKLSFASGFLPDYGAALSLAFRRQELDAVFLCLDVYPLTDGGGFTPQELPAYLYDDNPWNDVNYLWNRDVLTDVVPQYIRGMKAPVPFEDAFAYADRVTFGRSVSLPPYLAWRNAAPAAPQMAEDAFSESCRSALAGLTGYIAAHPDTQFYVFFPPYSAMYWDRQLRLGRAAAELYAARLAAETLLGFANTRIFCFLGCEEITTDLDRYSDAMHFDRSTGEMLASRLAAGHSELNRETCASFFDRLSRSVLHCDYDALFS